MMKSQSLALLLFFHSNYFVCFLNLGVFLWADVPFPWQLTCQLF